MSKSSYRVQIAEVVSSRYGGNARPLSWDERRDGVDVVKTTDDKTVRLWSDGGQSPPKAGWIILVNPEGPNNSPVPEGSRWTLFAIPPNQSLAR